MSPSEADFRWALCIVGEKGRQDQMAVHLELGVSRRTDGCFSSVTQSSISKRRCAMKLSFSEPVNTINTYGLFWVIWFCLFFSLSVLRQYQVFTSKDVVSSLSFVPALLSRLVLLSCSLNSGFSLLWQPRPSTNLMLAASCRMDFVKWGRDY